ncbi:hypothetical protein BS50DRAFT_654910 [Corynespora cassiicola Philippines]|uniref:Uncharacterized protein n=1 Tax=Corynespora cassiicola Philippines TaxID=1448308 RepID=A0A2T2N4W4_CORCC|nr:hypothetical protein BS50DRAFT_654910 [Corynespora cassiicola Philippines]
MNIELVYHSSTMSPSYPNWEWESEHSIRFAAPNKRVVYKILEDSEEEEVLHRKAAGTILCGRIKELAKLLSNHRIQLDSVTINELEVVLFLSTPPFPSKQKPTQGRRKSYATLSKLCTIPEERVIGNEVSPGNTSFGKWISLYENLSPRKRCAIYANI